MNSTGLLGDYSVGVAALGGDVDTGGLPTPGESTSDTSMIGTFPVGWGMLGGDESTATPPTPTLTDRSLTVHGDVYLSLATDRTVLLAGEVSLSVPRTFTFTVTISTAAARDIPVDDDAARRVLVPYYT